MIFVKVLLYFATVLLGLSVLGVLIVEGYFFFMGLKGKLGRLCFYIPFGVGERMRWRSINRSLDRILPDRSRYPKRKTDSK